MFLGHVFLAGFPLLQEALATSKKWKYLMNPSLQGRQGAIGSDYKHREIKPVSADAFLGEAGEPMSDNCAGTLLVVRGPE